MRKILFIIVPLILSGCITTKGINIDKCDDINPQVYQISGYYEKDEMGFTKRIIISRNWIKKINKNKYYLEVIFKEPMAEKKAIHDFDFRIEEIPKQ